MANPGGRGGFKRGHPGGPGRPRRAAERDYLKATVATVPLTRWRKVVERALQDAEKGDGAARAWLGKVLLGDNPAQLVHLVEELQAELWRLRSDEARAKAQGGGAAVPVPDGRAAGAG